MSVNSLDQALLIQEKFLKKNMLRQFSGIETQTMKQAVRFRDFKKPLIITDISKLGLNNTYKIFFKNTSKLAVERTKEELLRKISNPGARLQIKNKKFKASNDLDYAQRLAKKQVEDLENILNNKLKFAVKNNPKITATALKKIIADETKKFINVRVVATQATELNRITNAARLELFNQTVEVKYIRFNAVMDRRTSQICQARHGQVFIKEDLPGDYIPPLHVRCRSYLIPFIKEMVLTSEKIINQTIERYPKKVNKLL